MHTPPMHTPPMHTPLSTSPYHHPYAHPQFIPPMQTLRTPLWPPLTQHEIRANWATKVAMTRMGRTWESYKQKHNH